MTTNFECVRPGPCTKSDGTVANCVVDPANNNNLLCTETIMLRNNYQVGLNKDPDGTDVICEADSGDNLICTKTKTTILKECIPPTNGVTIFELVILGLFVIASMAAIPIIWKKMHASEYFRARLIIIIVWGISSFIALITRFILAYQGEDKYTKTEKAAGWIFLGIVAVLLIGAILGGLTGWDIVRDALKTTTPTP